MRSRLEELLREPALDDPILNDPTAVSKLLMPLS